MIPINMYICIFFMMQMVVVDANGKMHLWLLDSCPFESSFHSDQLIECGLPTAAAQSRCNEALHLTIGTNDGCVQRYVHFVSSSFSAPRATSIYYPHSHFVDIQLKRVEQRVCIDGHSFIRIK